MAREFRFASRSSSPGVPDLVISDEPSLPRSPPPPYSLFPSPELGDFSAINTASRAPAGNTPLETICPTANYGNVSETGIYGTFTDGGERSNLQFHSKVPGTEHTFASRGELCFVVFVTSFIVFGIGIGWYLIKIKSP
ncbi:hypothetical protein F5Y19DRAFT_472116 [Xylariaceae sp. FL1651]|nr:hypothetical protein F5Y19DRAFT_472116 [Xylariaceae sp. FL1651]